LTRAALVVATRFVLRQNTQAWRKVTAQPAGKKSQASIVDADERRNTPPRRAAALRRGRDRQPCQDPPHRGGRRPGTRVHITGVLPRHLPGQHHEPGQLAAVLLWGDRSTAGGPAAGASAAACLASRAGSSAATWGPAGPGRRVPRSAQSSPGPGFCRRSTATSWRSTSNSVSFDAAERASSPIQPSQAHEDQVEHPYCHKPPILPALG
jgi:hypothetical protein